MSERNPPGPPGFEIPDLELDAPVSKRPAPVSAARAAPARAATPAIGEISLDGLGDDDDFDLIQTGSNVELAVGASVQEIKRHTDTQGWPSGRTRSPDQLSVDSAEVVLVADYGAAPKNAILAPAYAYRVFSRRAPLKKSIAELHAQLLQAELGRDTELMQLSTELRPQLEASDVFRRLLEPIREVERLAGDRGAAFAEVDTGYKEQMARFDAELSRLREAERQGRVVSEEKSASKNGAENLLRRAEAKHQRVQIEIRGVMDLARQTLGPAGGDLPPAQAAKVAELEERGKALEPELAQAKSAHVTAAAALDQADAELRRLQTQIRQLERQKSSAAGGLEKQLSARAAGVSEAEKQRRDALAEVARAVLAARGSMPLSEPTLEALRHHDKVVDALSIRLETHLRALDSHDRERVKQGVIVVLSVLGAVLLSILLKAML